MKKVLLVPVIAGLCLYGCKESQPQQEAAPAIDTLAKKASYGVGLQLGEQFKTQMGDYDAELFQLGLKDALAGEAKLEAEVWQKALQEYSVVLQEKFMQEREQELLENLNSGKTFLEQFATEEGVVVTDSGLHYKVLEAGTGSKPKADDVVTVHYRGTLIDGTEFDSSYSRGQPASFPVTGVIAGWTEALQLMQEGAKWKLGIPAELAYGERGAGGKIGPNSTLIFEVELLDASKDDDAEQESAE